MSFPSLTIGSFTVSLPIIQGGMATRVSTANLAAAVAREGGIGIIAGTGMSNTELRKEINKAKELAEGKGKIGVNVLYAASNFASLIKEAMETGIDLVIYGAGFSKDIFKLGRAYNCPIVPIVSSSRLAKTSQKLGAAAVVVEGCEAGGHLGTDKSINEILPEVKQSVTIPVIAAGGISSGVDIYDKLKQGANGVQLATIFAASKESNVSDEFKNLYINAKEDDSIFISSPVGLPGRAIRTIFSDAIEKGKVKIGKCTNCLKVCNKSFCINQALEDAREGNLETGLVFAGKNVHKIKEILSVKDIINKLREEFEEASNKYGRLNNNE